MDAHQKGKRKAGAGVENGPKPIDSLELRSLLTSLSHELCRPLVSLRAGFDLLLDDRTASVPLEHRGHLMTMVSLCDELLHLTRGYLDYAGIVNRSRAPALGRYSLGAVMREIDRQFQSLALARGLSWEALALKPQAEVVTDASLCQQVFGNLVTNALKYTPEGGQVRVYGDIQGDFWVVTVTDSGQGIPADSLERVFEPFYRLARDERSGVEGNGLGLSICRELVERLGGTMTLCSTPGAGTTVKVRFPLAPSSDSTSTAQPARPARSRARREPNQD